jgi:hypothetical protein
MIPTVLLLVGIACLVVAAARATALLAPGRRPWSPRTTSAIGWAAVAWTVVTGLVLLVAPLATTVSGSATSGSGEVTTVTTVGTVTSHESLLEHEGAGVVGVLAVPVAIALAGAAPGPRTARGRRLGAGWVLLAACAVGAASLGAFYLPAAVALVVAGAKTTRPVTPSWGPSPCG